MCIRDSSSFSGCIAARFDCNEIDFSGWTLLVKVLGVWIDGAKPNFIWPIVSPETDVTLPSFILHFKYHISIHGNPFEVRTRNEYKKSALSMCLLCISENTVLIRRNKKNWIFTSLSLTVWLIENNICGNKVEDRDFPII